MAQIRTVVPSNAISNFRQVQGDAGGGFRLLADAMDVAYDYLLPKAVQEVTEQGDALGREIAKQQIGDPAAAVTTQMSTKSAPADRSAALGADAMAALGKDKGHDHSVHNGQTHAEWLRYSNQNAVRNDPLSPKLVEAMSFLGGMGVTMDVVSGGQEAAGEGGRRKGSTRHDHGMAADVDFYKDGRKLVPSNPEDRAILTQIIQTAKSRGLTGFGEGDDYMGAGRVHLGYGAPGVWGAGGKGANAPAWLREAFYGAPQGEAPVAMSTSGGEAPAYVPPTLLREADGKLTARLYGPSANPIMRAHDAAAGVAYQSDVFLKATADFMSMSEQFALDPQGFKQAADEYVKSIVEAAPSDFRMDIRNGLEKEAGRRFLGIMDERQRDIRQRAANSSGALADKWADDLASAIASGNQEEAAAARSELSAVLSARERLPGLSWTPEQSANFMAKAELEGQSRIKKAQDEQASTWKTALNTVIKAAKAGLHASDETILDNPLVQQMHPELWREAAAFTTLRDDLPTFNAMTPAQQAAQLAEMKKQPITADWETDLYGAAEKAAAANAKAWKEDPIKRAGEVLTAEPPPPLPPLDLANPEAFMSGLAARAAYGQKLMDAGYTSREVYVSKEEAKMIGGLFGKDIPPEAKAVAAGAIVGAMGEDAAGFFAQINTSDPVIPHVGALMARGGDPAVATEALQGQSLLDQKIVQAPSAAAVTAGMAKVEEALRATPGALGAMDGVKKTAVAIYAARIPAGADEETQKQVMDEAWQAALGQSNSLGRTTGGVQEVGGHQVLLPPDVAGEDLNSAVEAAFGFKWAEGWGSTIANAFGGKQSQGVDEAMWRAAAGGIPSLGGQPIDPELWNSEEIVLTPVGGSRYMMSVNRNGVMIDIGVQGQPDDVPFIFDANLLIEASLVPK